jgi:PAS domain S-box-containing protein
MAMRDIYARQLEEREEWFRSTLTSLGDAVIATDGHGHVTFLNSMAEKLMGTTLSVARGKYIENIFPW